MSGLELEETEDSCGVDDGGDAGEILFAFVERRAEYVGEAEDEPVEKDQRCGGPELREGGSALAGELQ